ncbi:hypothetical protein AAMO2058_000674400 [Amorphochlora amoebiformis]
MIASRRGPAASFGAPKRTVGNTEISVPGPSGANGYRISIEEDSNAKYKDTYELCTSAEAPEWMRRPFILRGYRVRFSFRLLATSIFYCHNETGNIWTHLLPATFFLAAFVEALVSPSSMDEGKGHGEHVVKGGGEWEARFWVGLYLGGAFMCLIISALFHTFKSRNLQTHVCWLTADKNGINILFLASYLPGLVFGFWCYPFWRRVHVVAVSSLLLGAGLFANMQRFRKCKNFQRRFEYMMASIGVSMHM